MPDKKINIPNLQRIAKSLPNQDFLRLYMGFQGNPDIFYLKPYFIERFGEKFLNSVMHLKSSATEAMLHQCPEILAYRGNINSPSGTVTNVSALELIQGHPFVLEIILSGPYDMKDEDHRELFGNALLYHVIRGNQETVVAMLRHYPELLLYRGNVRDFSGRMFTEVTALELATWALDVRHMAPAILACLNDNEERKDFRQKLVPELQQQFDIVVKEGGGVNYSIGCGLLKISRDPSQLLPGETCEKRDALLNRLLDRHNGCLQYNGRIFYFHNLSCPKKLVEITTPDAISALKGLMNKKERKLEVDQSQIINNDAELKIIQKNVTDSQHIFKEKHYDFTPLTEALKVYVKSFDAGNNWTWDQCDARWCTIVGLAQHYAPAHVAQHYCNPDESFDPQNNNTPPTFKEKGLRRVLTFYNWLSSNADKNEPWWPSSAAAGSDALGLDIGIFRGAWRGGGTGRVGSFGTRTDLSALTALCEIRTAEVPMLKQLLDSLQKPDAEPEPTCCVVQ